LIYKSSNKDVYALRIVREPLSKDYRRLIDYLKKRNWEKANQETQNLLLKAVGKYTGRDDCLGKDEIKGISCETLQIIDRLWVKFSEGKFGFNVQRKIWENIWESEKVKVFDRPASLYEYSKTEDATRAYAKIEEELGWKPEKKEKLGYYPFLYNVFKYKPERSTFLMLLEHIKTC
jgi:hypothetical protein